MFHFPCHQLPHHPSLAFLKRVSKYCTLLDFFCHSPVLWGYIHSKLRIISTDAYYFLKLVASIGAHNQGIGHNRGVLIFMKHMKQCTEVLKQNTLAVASSTEVCMQLCTKTADCVNYIMKARRMAQSN